MTDRRCGTCKWWAEYSPGYGKGMCLQMVPRLPFWATVGTASRFQSQWEDTKATSGDGCATWEDRQ